ncbi:MAG: hypothetical protein M1834_009214 [Cirrosporium novae-zelandiae]|nr:MAG: hypothetical protein M1834_009214 [Cirrosporium novae-zelandiae]
MAPSFQRQQQQKPPPPKPKLHSHPPRSIPQSRPSLPATHKVRNIILAIAIFSITCTGAWYGAGLKMKREHKQTIKEQISALPIDRIAQLTTSRQRLIRQRTELERKIADVRSRMQSQTQSQSGDADGSGRKGQD